MIQCIVFILISLSTVSALRWNSSGFTTNPLTTISFKSTTDGPEIDVYIGEQITIIKNIRSSTLSITIFCFISGYNTQSEIKFFFCKNDICDVTVTDGELERIHYKYDMKSIETFSSFKGKKGLKLRVNLTSSLEVLKIDSSGDYHCEAHDTSGDFMIRSSNIQIRDKVYWEENLVLNENKDKYTHADVRQEGLPNKIKCNPAGIKLNPNRPAWINQEFVSPVYWSVCPVKTNYESLIANDKMTIPKCVTFTISKWEGTDTTLSPIELTRMTDWNVVVNDKGELVIFHLKQNTKPIELTYSLLCYTKKQERANHITIYFKDIINEDIKTGVVFNSTLIDYKRPLRAVSPELQNVSLYSRTREKIDRDVPPVSIYCLYNASLQATTKWLYNGAILTQMNEYRSFDDYKVNFEGDITSEINGKYTLQVTDGIDSITMHIVVTVLGSPTLVESDCLPVIRHVWENDSAIFNCSYKNAPQKLVVYVNKQEISIQNLLPQSRNELQKIYPYLSLLNFSISQTPNSPSGEVTMIYSVYNLTKTLGQTVYQDHTVMFKVKNDFGLSVKSTSIYTVPRPQSLFGNGMPHESNCTTACSSLERHTFKCNIDLKPYENKDLIVDHYWTINGHRLEQTNVQGNLFAPYFVVNPDNKELTLLPVKSNDTDRDNFVKNSLKNNYIICNIDLLSVLNSKDRFKYNSINDETVKQSLQARITLDYQDINQAYIYWIVAVILVLLILLIMIILLARYCMRNKGETYQLDKIERQHGYDPEKEVQEEMFKPYQREDHEPDVMSASTGDKKLSISGHSIGSVDDGELDTYDLDPSNFNEDGSIIGKYGENPRSRAAMAH